MGLMRIYVEPFRRVLLQLKQIKGLDAELAELERKIDNFGASYTFFLLKVDARLAIIPLDVKG